VIQELGEKRNVKECSARQGVLVRKMSRKFLGEFQLKQVKKDLLKINAQHLEQAA